jgi:hypothetical protein
LSAINITIGISQEINSKCFENKIEMKIQNLNVKQNIIQPLFQNFMDFGNRHVRNEAVSVEHQTGEEACEWENSTIVQSKASYN